MKNIVRAQPTAISAALVAILNAMVLLGPLSLTVDQISAINIAVVAVLGVFVHQSVTPMSNVVAFQTNDGAVAGPAFADAPNGQPVDVHQPKRQTLQNDSR